MPRKPPDGRMGLSGLFAILSPEFQAAVGRITLAWGHVEQSYDLLYLSLVVMGGRKSGRLGPDEHKAMSRPMIDRQVNLKAALRARGLDSDLLNLALNLTGRTLAAKRRRDHYSHGHWTPVIDDRNSARLITKSWRNMQPHEFRTVTLAELDDLFHELDRLSRAYTALTLSLSMAEGGQRPDAVLLGLMR